MYKFGTLCAFLNYAWHNLSDDSFLHINVLINIYYSALLFLDEGQLVPISERTKNQQQPRGEIPDSHDGKIPS